MKNTNIADSVFKVNLKYVKLQNETKELFFKCLDENRDVSYFNAKIREIWGNIDYSFMLDEITDYEALIHERNIEGKEITEVSKQGDVFDLVPLAVIIGVENKFVKQKEKEYKSSQKYVNKLETDIKNATSETYKEIKEEQKQEYLKLKVQRYTNQIVPYYSQSTGKKIRDVELSTYCSMIHNTNLTRAGWNTTLKDAEQINYNFFVIPYHPFSCEHCIDHQNRVMTRQQVINLIGVAEEKEGNILHPNCKCVLVAIKNYNDIDKIESPFKYSLTREEKINISNIRQKTNSLTLQKEKIKTDMKIQKSLGNQDVVDELNNMRNSINKKIRELQSKLPTEELKKQVVAINREKRISSNKYVEQARKNIIKKEQNKTKEKLLKETKRNKEKLNQMQKLSSQTHKEMQELFKIRENRPKYMEQLEKKQQELKEIRKIIKQENKDMKYWKSKQQELSLKVDIKNLKDLINK